MKVQLALVTTILALSGCTTIGGGPAGPNGRPASTGPAAPETIISALNGGLIGGAVGTGLSDSDRRIALQAEYKALEHTAAGKPVEWQGSRGNGSVTAAQPYRVGSQDCRQYMQTVNAGGQTRSARATACRNPDGSWTPLT